MKKSQVWYTDFMIGIFIFSIIVVIFYTYAHSAEQDPKVIITDLSVDAKSISGSLVTEGYPSNWTLDNVVVIGLTDGKQRIVPSKLSMFADMDYYQTKTKLRTNYEYYFYLEYMNGTRIDIDGKDSLGLDPNSSSNLMSLSRIMVYDSKLVNMVVQLWQ